jgi:hypothetical protein
MRPVTRTNAFVCTGLRCVEGSGKADRVRECRLCESEQTLFLDARGESLFHLDDLDDRVRDSFRIRPSRQRC